MKNRWMWYVIGLLFTLSVGSICMAWIALRNPPVMVERTDDWK